MGVHITRHNRGQAKHWEVRDARDGVVQGGSGCRVVGESNIVAATIRMY